ncbi:unnamed protein product [Larinioides sclopetarius]|uniref:Uncharacterized protein n=1 Tax=Larinioides sclopetarius TaxID=280406 RepID=A0AAV1ZJQ4_9ARAC
MSSHNKDPLEKQDTPSESSESHSESDIDEAEENLEHLKIEERVAKGELKHLDNPNQEVASTSKCEPIAGLSGVQKHHVESSDANKGPEPEFASLIDPEKDVETKASVENIGTKLVEGESRDSSEEEVEEKSVSGKAGTRMEDDTSDTTSSSPRFIQSSTGVTPSSELEKNSSVSGSSRPKGKISYSKLPINVVVRRFMYKTSRGSSSSRRFDYATDSANTSADVSEIRSEIADISAEGSVYHDAAENLEKEQSPSYASAVERQSSETSESNISELQDDSIPSATSESSSVSSSTPSEEQGHQAYLAQLQREAEARGVPISTSSGIGSTNRSELIHLKAWNTAGEIGFYRNNADDPCRDVSDSVAQGSEQQPSAEPMDDAQISGHQQIQPCDLPFGQEPNVPEVAMSESGTRKMNVKERPQISSASTVSTSKRRTSKGLSDLRKAEKGYSEKLRPKFKPDTSKGSLVVASKSSPALYSSSESKSSSSDESHRKESRGSKCPIEAQTFSKSGDRKSWQRPGLLYSMQHSTMSSKESVIPEEEEDRTSPLREQACDLMETCDPISEKMETTPEKCMEGVAESAEQSVLKPSIESSNKAYVSETETTLRDSEKDFEVSDFERSVGKTKREPKLSSSPPSDEKLSSSPPKAATSRPKKKARSEKMPGKTRRTRHDSGGSVPKSFSLGDLQQSESTSTPDLSDYTPSDDEKETAL